jgi:hypothetical protein
LNPNLLTRVNNLPYRTKDRKSEIFIRRPINQIDTITYRLPAGYKTDQIPEKVSIITKFGEYSSELISDKDVIRYIRTFKLLNGSYPVSDYSDFVDFFEKVSVSDEHKIALERKI